MEKTNYLRIVWRILDFLWDTPGWILAYGSDGSDYTWVFWHCQTFFSAPKSPSVCECWVRRRNIYDLQNKVKFWASRMEKGHLTLAESLYIIDEIWQRVWLTVIHVSITIEILSNMQMEKSSPTKLSDEERGHQFILAVRAKAKWYNQKWFSISEKQFVVGLSDRTIFWMEP